MCLTGDCARYKAWKRGREALQGFGQTHGRLIDAFRLDRRYGKRLVCPTTGSGGYRVPKARFTPPTAEEYVEARLEPPDNDGNPGEDDDDGIPGNECWYESYTYYVTVPNRNDGLLGINYTVWESDYDGPAKGGPNLGDHSFLYSDRPSSYTEGGTGFNHAEMVYNERRYDSSDDPNIDDSAFNRGDPNPPMRDAREWVRDVLRPN